MKSLSLFPVALGLMASAGALYAAQITEPFDSAATAAAHGWAGVGNTSSGNSYGWSGTSRAGGPAGEAGGLFAATSAMTYYAAPLGGTYDLSCTFQGTGCVAIASSSPPGLNNFIAIGFLNTATAGGSQKSLLGVTVQEYDSTGQNWRGRCGINLDGGPRIDGIPGVWAMPTNFSGTYTFSFDYTPNGGSYSAGGLTARMWKNGTLLSSMTASLTAAQRTAGATFNAFGLATGGLSSPSGFFYFYADNLSGTATAPNPTVQFESASSSGLENLSPASINVTLSRVCTQSVTVSYSVTGGSATGAGVDYSLPAGSLTFPAGVLSQQIPVTLVNDGLYENDETIEVTLSNPAGNGAVLGANTRNTFTIVEPAPALQLRATRVGSNMVLSWPAPFVDYQLQHRPDLSSPPDWADVTNTATVLNNFRSVTLPLSLQHDFFRLVPTQPSGPFTNALGMEFVRITPGAFTMGSFTDFKLADSGSTDYDEQPTNTVTLTRSFYVLKDKVAPTHYAQSGLSGLPNDASWNNAAAFCDWLSRFEGRTYRLPTEAEWEYVFENPQGALNLAGGEWVQDWHWIYTPGSLTNPLGPATGLTKVIRSGTARLTLPPDATSSPRGLNPAAFRVVMELAPATNAFTGPPPFNQAAVKQSTAPALLGPSAGVPYFTVRFALPIPPNSDTNWNGALLGVDQSVLDYNHSPGFEILPNGDALAVFFSAPKGNENTATTRFIQARLRYGAEEWDMPELFYDFKDFNEQSALLWTDGSTIRFFGGGRKETTGVQFNPEWMPFKTAVSTNNGASWNLTLPSLDAPATDYTPQPITSAFRAPDGAIYFAMDAADTNSFLWRSWDDGLTWHDMGGRTGGRHSTIVPLDGNGNLLSYGGKSTEINGYMPKNTSSNWGLTWSASTQSPFPKLGSNQRPSLIKLANGKLVMVGDSQYYNTTTPPAGWTNGVGCYVAISADNGTSWRIKSLPVTLLHEKTLKAGTLGYSSVRQGPNGIIQVLTTRTYPCIHYEFNEAWIYSSTGDLVPESSGGTVRSFSENYPGGALHAAWSARICPNGRYLLDGLETVYYENGQKEREVTWASGRRTGTETYWAPDGTQVFSWSHNLAGNTSTWVHYYLNGRKRVESSWNTNPQAGSLARSFRGFKAGGAAYGWKPDGTAAFAYNFINGTNAGAITLPPAQP